MALESALMSGLIAAARDSEVLSGPFGDQIMSKLVAVSDSDMRHLNIATMFLFVGSLLFFSIFKTTNNTARVLTYFVPDMSLTVLNVYITFWLANETAQQITSFLDFFLVKAMIDLGYYINIASAFFYAALYVEHTWLHTGLLSAFDNLWVQFWDIMKFKVPATLHALTLKWYSDELLAAATI